MSKVSFPLLKIDESQAEQLIDAACHSAHVSGLTHDFYRYPARFSPSLVRAAIEAFTKPGDLVVDPFVGGGTTLVESIASGRRSIGTDISALAAFISDVKTTIYSESDLRVLQSWANRVADEIDPQAPADACPWYEKTGYLRHLDSKGTWRLRKAITQAITSADRLKYSRLRKFGRCAVLRTAQWALDGRKILPAVSSFRDQLRTGTLEMINGSLELAIAARAYPDVTARCIQRPIAGIQLDAELASETAPRLIVTSPPYPGVHVLYHRWQVHGGKETPAPFWIANKLDGDGAAYYTMGDRKSHAQAKYFEEIRKALDSIAAISNESTTLVQVVAFSEPEWQLPRYLSVADDAGFEEHFLPRVKGKRADDLRLWRDVPNRKWYASQKGHTSGSQEVVLFHRLRRCAQGFPSR